MKEIKAYVRSELLSDVINSLSKLEELRGISVSTVTGFGRQRERLSFLRSSTYSKIETVCSDEIAPIVMKKIEKAAQTKKRGDGKIYVFPVLESVRIVDSMRNVP